MNLTIEEKLIIKKIGVHDKQKIINELRGMEVYDDISREFIDDLLIKLCKFKGENIVF